jgi:DnaK suppressor protein
VAKTSAKKSAGGKPGRIGAKSVKGATQVKKAPAVKKAAAKAVKLVKKAEVKASAKSAKKPAPPAVAKPAASKPAPSKPLASKPAAKPAAPAKPATLARPAEAPAKPPASAARHASRDESRRNNGTPPPPIPEAVPTDGKPRKNQAGFNSRELEHFRDLLLAKRRELIGDMSAMEREALRSTGNSNLSNLPIHMADMGTDNYEQEFTLGLVQKDRDLLREINAALAKIQNGTYGICEGTGKPINKERLEYQPWARYSIEYARMLERRAGR